jgi:hypothetical protein
MNKTTTCGEKNIKNANKMNLNVSIHLLYQVKVAMMEEIVMEIDGQQCL